MSRVARQAPAVGVGLLAVAYLMTAANIPDAGFTRGISARAYPVVLGAILLTCAVLSAITTARDNGRAGTAALVERPLHTNSGRLAAFVAALLAYVVGLPHAGFLIATTGLLMVGVVVFTDPVRPLGRRVVEAAIFAAILSLGLFAAFDLALGVTLPTLPSCR